MLSYKSILITGGTGSFGKMFVKTLLQQCPNFERIVVFSRDELKQFEMMHQPPFDDSRIRYFIGDVRDIARLYRAFDGIDIIIHAAALKQVPACEYNPFEAVNTNILGAQNVINAAIDRNVKRVVALSTDKACAPVSLYGATKLCSDKLFIASNAYSGRHDTIFSVVRYGNVAGSRGSVVPFFRKLIANGATELPITDNRMTRFWLRLEEAAKMVLDTLNLMQGGEIYIRKIPSIHIVDLAKAMAPHLPLKDIGIRPGEKIHEMLIAKEDAKHTVELDDYYIILPQFNFGGGKNIPNSKPVPEDFEYESGHNTWWLSVSELWELLRDI